MVTGSTKLSFGIKGTYGMGQLGEGLMARAIGAFLLFYYSQVLGLAPGLAGLAIGGSLIVDAFVDPLVGSMSDNLKSKLGRRHPFMFGSILPAGVAFLLLFNPPVHSQWGMFFWLMTMALLTRIAMSFYNVPHLSLGAEMATNFEDRTSVVGFRQFFATFGAVFAVIIGFQVFFKSSPEFHNGQLNPAAYQPFSLLLVLLAVGAIFWSAFGTRRLIATLPQPAVRAHGATVVQVFLDTALALRNRSFRWLFIGVLIVFVMVGVDTGLNIYINTYFWELTGNQMAVLAIASPIGVMAGTALTRVLHKRFDKQPAVVWGTAWWSICQIVPIVLRMGDAFPANHSASLMTVLIIVRFLQGVGVVQALVSFGSMMADIADEHELLTGRRQEGIFFGAVSFSGKCASGAGNMVAGFGLAAIAWPTGVTMRTAADVPADALFNLGLLFGPIVAGFAVVAVWCYSHYNLDRAKHAAIVAQLAQRRVDLAAADALVPGAPGSAGSWAGRGPILTGEAS